MRWVSERECLKLKCLSLDMRMKKAMATGIAIMTKVQAIQAVLWTVSHLVSGVR